MKVLVEGVLRASKKGKAGWKSWRNPTPATGDEGPVRVRVTNARDSHGEKFQMAWTENAGQSMEIYLPPGQSRSFTAPKVSSTKVSAQLQLHGDTEMFDDASYYAAPEFEQAKVAWLGSESINDPNKLRYYVERVFPEGPRQPVRIVRPYTNSAFSSEMLNSSAFAVIAGTPAPEEATALHEWLAGGKSALLVLTNAQMGPTLAAVAGLPEVQMTEATGDYALLGDIDFSHPIFAAFSEPRFSDFTQIHFWKHRRWEIPTGAQAHVLAKFDDGSPALAQLSVGKGNLLVLASGWDPIESQLAVSSKFPPLMQRMLDWSGADKPMRFQFLTGDAIPSPGSAGVSTASSPVSEIEWQKPGWKKDFLLKAGEAFHGHGPARNLYGHFWQQRASLRREFVIGRKPHDADCAR